MTADRGARAHDFLEYGYKAGIILSFLGVVASAVYLFYFIWLTSLPGEISSEAQLLGLTAQRRLLLLSTGIFVGMSFGFMGFALFLIQAKGDLDLDASADSYKLKVARLSPGLFVILCATVIIITCVTFRIEYEISAPREADGNSTSTAEAPPLRRAPPPVE